MLAGMSVRAYVQLAQLPRQRLQGADNLFLGIEHVLGDILKNKPGPQKHTYVVSANDLEIWGTSSGAHHSPSAFSASVFAMWSRSSSLTSI